MRCHATSALVLVMSIAGCVSNSRLSDSVDGGPGQCPGGCGADLICIANQCVPASCDDQQLSGSETDIDCGGECPACSEGEMCAEPQDCSSLFCSDSVCRDCTSDDECVADPATTCYSGRCVLACPGSGVVSITDYESPWVLPASGDAERRITLSTEDDLHYRSIVIDLDIETSAALDQIAYSVFRLRDENVQGATQLTHYGSFLPSPAPGLLLMRDPNDVDVTASPGLKPSTSYHLTYDYNAETGEAVLTLTETGEGPVSMEFAAPSSLVPKGNGLKLMLGLRTSGGLYDQGYRPPHGWSLSNLVVTMTPGGPFGEQAPPCP